MIDVIPADQATASRTEELRAQLAADDTVLASTPAILRHLLANRDEALFSDEVIASVRAMVTHLAWQLLLARAQADDIADPDHFACRKASELAGLLLQDAGFLTHAHALALEARLTDHLQRRNAIDAVLPSLMQELVASSDAQVATVAMRAMASQARFMQSFRRMELPLGELPGDLFHKALLTMRSHAGDNRAAEIAERRLRDGFDESGGRIGILARLLSALGAKANRALSIDHAGLALFATALGMASGQDRNLAILGFGGNQHARLAVSLRATGLNQAQVEAQFLYFHPEAKLPEEISALSADAAAALLFGEFAEGER
ncbi:hypothetical protein [Alteraurantiacibacter aquimixticola]|uniref:DUF2336 domain-containing protein n=1 Tax=Alteraurantiacibacter aquimixticola TaxID=2489173 RepID=A0A4T3F164_9SPHN|nr:hypothetical protein [Alteraurantiacibacter aquimixticola]TIX50005.1 hypothetical protein E5222_06800 [Alteraurantiacibacter aquimixticola]